MQFHEKLDFLMKVAGVQNSTLGRELSFDASYISRIRSGKRALPRRQPFVEPVARYIARSLTADYQKRTVAEQLCPGHPWPEDREKAEALLCAWLSGQESDSSPVERLLTGLSALGAERGMPPLPPVSAPEAGQTTMFYYGNEGKRQAVERFLSRLCALETPVEIHLFSEEDMAWMSEDKEFGRRWGMLLIRFIQNGGRIRIIHTIRRDIGEMMEGVRKWLPLYMGGAIQSYYYPKLRDNIFRRTLFIAPGCAAICSTSVGTSTEGRLNILTEEPAAVEALEGEFCDYFALCKPLMQVFRLQNNEALWKTLADFDASEGDLITAQPCLSRYTTPDEVIRSVSARCSSSAFAKLCRASRANFERSLSAGSSYYDFLVLPDLDTVRAGRVPLPLCDLYGQPELCYTRQEFCLHLRNMLRLLREEPGYRVALPEQFPPNILLFVKEDTGAFVARLDQPSAVFGLDEPRMIAALWEYSSRLVRMIPGREKVIARLEDYLTRIEAD